GRPAAAPWSAPPTSRRRRTFLQDRHPSGADTAPPAPPPPPGSRQRRPPAPAVRESRPYRLHLDRRGVPGAGGAACFLPLRPYGPFAASRGRSSRRARRCRLGQRRGIALWVWVSPHASALGALGATAYRRAARRFAAGAVTRGGPRA